MKVNLKLVYHYIIIYLLIISQGSVLYNNNQEIFLVIYFIIAALFVLKKRRKKIDYYSFSIHTAYLRGNVETYREDGFFGNCFMARI